MLAWVVAGVLAWLVSAAGLAALIAAVIRRANHPDAPPVLIPLQRTGSPRPTATPLRDLPMGDCPVDDRPVDDRPVDDRPVDDRARR